MGFEGLSTLAVVGFGVETQLDGKLEAAHVVVSGRAFDEALSTAMSEVVFFEIGVIGDVGELREARLRWWQTVDCRIRDLGAI